MDSSHSWRSRLRGDGVAGLVLGVESVPDGLAAGLLAGVNPLSGLYAYLFGMLGGSFATGSTFMAVQATGAMAVIVADVPAAHGGGDAARVLFTLTILTGVVMLLAGILRLGHLLRFVSNTVMVGFISAVGVNIVLGQLAQLTGYHADGANRVIRAANTLLHPGEIHGQTLAVGVTTIALILVLERTRLGPLALVAAVVITSAFVAVAGWDGVFTVSSIAEVPRALPLPQLPLLRAVPELMVPALSLAFIGLVQGAAVATRFPNPGGGAPDASRDFLGQGVANIVAGVFRGMPVGGSMSATSINHTAGARTRLSLVIAAGVMALAILLLAGAIGYIAMPSLAGLLILIGIRTIKLADLKRVWRTGTVQKAVVSATFVLTMVIPIQDAVLIGVALSFGFHVARQSRHLTVRRLRYDEAGHLTESDPPVDLPSHEVVALQPYGSVFFAAAAALEELLPTPTAASRRSVVILRLRGRTDLGTTVMDVLDRYVDALEPSGSRLVLVVTSERVRTQLRAAGLADRLGADGIYVGDERVGAALRQAYADASAWVRSAAESPS